ncbi:MAG TPA: hypothetical protein VI282_18585 [Verrucomicrobiae bacterium]
MKARILFRLNFILLFISLLAVSGRAEVWQSQEFNFAITLPESGWTRLKPPTDLIRLMIRSQDQTKVIGVSVLPTGDRSPESFIDAFRKKFFAQGTGKINVDERITISAHQACRLKDIWIMGGREMHKATTMVINNGVLYMIDCMGSRSDPMDDPAINECVASFHLLSDSASAQLASKQAATKKTAPFVAAMTKNTIDKRLDMIFYLMVSTIVVIVIAFVVRRILSDLGTKTKAPPPYLFPSGSTRTTPPPLPQPITTPGARVSSPQKLDAN